VREQTISTNVVYYLHADHLGSASLTTDADGAWFSEQRYFPYGSTRTGSSPTDRQFTGQRAEAGLGSLYDYGARFYSPALGRFLSADTMVPDPANPQTLNRYAYTLNNPKCVT
jgi:RHS repeat-associated protein